MYIFKNKLNCIVKNRRNTTQKRFLIILPMMMIYSLFSSSSHAFNYGSLKPLVSGGYNSSRTIDVQELFEKGSVSGSWNIGGGSPVEVFAERCQERRYNYFSTTASIDGARVLSPEDKVVLRTEFIEIVMTAELGTNKKKIELPWNNYRGEGSNGLIYGCLPMRTKGVYAGRTGEYTIRIIKKFTQDDKMFNKISVFFYGSRDNNNQGWVNIDTSDGSHYYSIDFNFTNWTSPYKCNLKLNPQTVDFSAISESQLIKGIAAKTLTVETECSGGDFDPNGPILDDLATNIRFQSGDTVDGDSDFRTKNPTTNKVNDNLVFRINDRHTNQPVKNNHRIDIELTKDNSNNPISSFARQFDVYPYWKGGTNRDIPLGHFETSGVVIFELE